MTERLDFAWVYSITPLATFRMMTRLEHLEERARHLGQQGHTVLELRERQGVFHSVFERRVDPELAAWGPRFFSGKNMVKQTQLWQPPIWDGTRSHDAIVEIEGIAVTVAGSGGVSPLSSTSTRYVLNLTVESAGRLSGRKLEAGIAGALGRTIEAEHEFRVLWLERQHSSGF